VDFLSKSNAHSLKPIPRCIFKSKFINPEIHGFSDASETAYAVVVLLRSFDEGGTIQVSLITLKSRVVPVKTQSIPRLELCGAKLLADLIHNVIESCQIACPISTWTDSTIVLDWLSSHPTRWKTFVANRTTKTLEKVSHTSWLHVRSQDIPADNASRMNAT